MLCAKWQIKFVRRMKMDSVPRYATAQAMLRFQGSTTKNITKSKEAL